MLVLLNTFAGNMTTVSSKLASVISWRSFAIFPFEVRTLAGNNKRALRFSTFIEPRTFSKENELIDSVSPSEVTTSLPNSGVTMIKSQSEASQLLTQSANSICSVSKPITPAHNIVAYM